MKYLLDTHIFLWSMLKTGKLSSNVKQILESSPNVFISTITLWELSVKFGLGKLHLDGTTPEDLWSRSSSIGYKPLVFSPEEAVSFYHLVKLHKDAFDRMLVWQAIKNNLILISMDEKMKLYSKNGLQLIW
jgi:PIN domain nuclease of toxin-antitoxin system